jgi:hypothetical protein
MAVLMNACMPRWRVHEYLCTFPDAARKKSKEEMRGALTKTRISFFSDTAL